MNITPNAKRCRIDSSETESGTSDCSPVLSPDQRERMLMKKTEAKIIKMSKNSIISRKIGLSWFQVDFSIILANYGNSTNATFCLKKLIVVYISSPA